MTGERVRATQAARPPKPPRLIRGTVSALNPLTVQIAGGGAVAGIAVAGATYAVGDGVLVFWQEPGVGPVFPLLTGYTAPVVPSLVGSFTYSGTCRDWDGGQRRTSITRSGVGGLGLLNLQASVGSTSPASGSVIGTINETGFRPPRTVNLDVVLFNGSWGSQRVTLDVGVDGRVIIQTSTTAIQANAGIFGAITLPLV